MKKYSIYKILPLILAHFLYCFILQKGDLYAQPTLEWMKYYPDSSTFKASSGFIALDDSGNVYVTGLGEVSNVYRYCTMKYNPSGVQQWVTFYLGTNSGGRIPYDITTDKNSNVYVAGYDYTSTNGFNFCTIKYNSSGIQQWIKFFDYPTHYDDEAKKIAVDNAGNIYVSGFSELCQFSCKIYTLLKYTNNGDFIWSKSYGNETPGGDIGDMKIDNDCNIYITGSIDNCDDAAIIKFDSSGQQQWVNTVHKDGGCTIGKSIALDNYKNIIVTGQTYKDNGYSSFTVKYTPTGVQQWIRKIEPILPDTDSYASSGIEVDKVGDIYISGFYKHNSQSPMKFFIVKYSSNGDSLWSQTDTDSLSPPFYYMDIDKDDNIYLAGTNFHVINSLHFYQMILLKYNTTGYLKWKFTSNFENPISVHDFLIDKNFNIYLCGNYFINYHNCISLLKYSQPNGIKKIGNLTLTFKLYQNYPNPFNPVTKIKFDISNESNIKSIVKLTIYDIEGREMETLINWILSSGSYEINCDASKYASGVYFYKLTAGDYTEAKKMLIIK
jgi:hypothetical protein